MSEKSTIKTKNCTEHGATLNSATSEKPYSVEDAVNEIGYGAFQRQVLCLSGLVYTADAIEIIILSLIGQFVACDWTIFRWQNSLLSSAVFLAMLIGGPVFGVIADKYGRRNSLGSSLLLVFVFGSLSAASSSYYWMLALRFFTGFALGGIPQVVTLCCEYYPTNLRGRASFYLCYFWAFGAVGIVLLAWVVMANTNNWKLLLFLTAIPSLIAISCFKWFPESPRYFVVSKKIDQANETIQKMAEVNQKPIPAGRLIATYECSNRGRMQDLFDRKYRLTICLYSFIGCSVAFCYYGIVLMSPELVQFGSVAGISEHNETQNYFSDLSAAEHCIIMTKENYLDLLWTSAAELPGVFVYSFLIEKTDRKKLMSISCVICSLLVFILLIKTKKFITLIFLFGARAIILALFQMVHVMISESFPTTLRAVALGVGSAFCRLGGIASPYVSQVLLVANPNAAIGVLGGSVFLAGIAAAYLPLETRGRALVESHEDESTMKEKR